jgi:LysW-gamma-L-lysine carboxypeptidase
VYGAGDSRLDHTLDEHLSLDEYMKSVDVLREALKSLAAWGR